MGRRRRAGAVRDSLSFAMHSIDFLPVEYRQSHARRRAQPWQVIVVALFATLIGASATGQWYAGRHAAGELAAIESLYTRALAQTVELQKMQGDLDLARASADLYAYLRHPWPRTRIVDALLAPLPEGIAFEELEISQEKLSNAAMTVAPVDPLALEKELAVLPPARRDLRKLHDEFDARQTVVSLSGSTDEISTLHAYLGKLAGAGLFSRVGLPQIESSNDKASHRLRFNVRMIVCPGYGQARGPRMTAAEGITPTDAAADPRIVAGSSILNPGAR